MLDPRYRGGVGIDKDFIEFTHEEAVNAISGTHDMDGILVLSGPRFKKNLEIRPVGIIDIFPTILCDLEIPIPTYVDGKIIKDAFKDEFSFQSVQYIENNSYEGGIHSSLSSDEEEAMKKALGSLGYLS
jgi:hypothetical protein